MAEGMMVADLGPGVTIVVSHAGQPTPTDARELSELFGVRGHAQVIPISESQARPATDAEKLAARVGDQQAQADTGELAALKARVAELEAGNAGGISGAAGTAKK